MRQTRNEQTGKVPAEIAATIELCPEREVYKTQPFLRRMGFSPGVG